MTVEIRVPQMGESVTEGVIAQWLKAEGEQVSADEPIVEVETDKITVEVPAPAAGVLRTRKAAEGDTVAVGDVLGIIEDGAQASAGATASKEVQSPAGSGPQPASRPEGQKAEGQKSEGQRPNAQGSSNGQGAAMPAARAEADRRGVDLQGIEGTGRGGRILKEDVQRASTSAKSSQPASDREQEQSARGPQVEIQRQGHAREERKAMTPLRRRVAERLVQAQQTAAILTTFNEVDMSAVMELRTRFKERFIERHGVKLGFMSFFVKSAIEALKAFPAINAEIDGNDVVYKHYYDIGVAVGGGKGLVVPVLRDADRMTFADIEKQIAELGKKAKDNKLSLEELSGGTFTISNGGVYGSMMSTPILNPPQTGILGLHNIVERPMAVAGKVEIRPIMYIALSYDHRLVDGREAVQFLVRIKQCMEDPERLFLSV